MARLSVDPLLKTLRGRIGDLVFRRYGDKIVVSRRPAKPSTPRTPAQRKQESKMVRALPYAKAQMATAEGRAYYSAAARRSGGNAFSKAVGDHMSGPVVQEVEIGGWLAGGIAIEASDNVGVVRVQVALLDAAGGVVELGEAERLGECWRYVPAVPADGVETVEVRAWDRPGNQGSMRVSVP